MKDTKIERAITYKDARRKLMLAHAATKTLWGFVLAIRRGVSSGKVAMDGEIREKLATVTKAAEIGIASLEGLFEEFDVTPPMKDQKLDMECVMTMCIIMAKADETCLNKQAKETK